MLVDVYGRCGKLRCGGPHGVTTGNNKMAECNDLTKKYFFYLALENTFCMYIIYRVFIKSRNPKNVSLYEIFTHANNKT